MGLVGPFPASAGCPSAPGAGVKVRMGRVMSKRASGRGRMRLLPLNIYEYCSNTRRK